MSKTFGDYGCWDFNDGDEVYCEGEGDEVFTISQHDYDGRERKCWIGDENGSGWYVYFSILKPVED